MTDAICDAQQFGASTGEQAAWHLPAGLAIGCATVLLSPMMWLCGMSGTFEALGLTARDASSIAGVVEAHASAGTGEGGDVHLGVRYIPPMFPLESLFKALDEDGGRYVLVGGLAVVLHGHLRATGDVDLVVDLATEQVHRTLSALERAGFRPYVPVPASEFADPARRAEWIREKTMLVFSLRPPQGVPVVDLFLEPPMPFDRLWSRSVVVTMRGVPVRVAGLDDLIELKRQTGRPEDVADADALAEIQRLRQEQP